MHHPTWGAASSSPPPPLCCHDSSSPPCGFVRLPRCCHLHCHRFLPGTIHHSPVILPREPLQPIGEFPKLTRSWIVRADEHPNIHLVPVPDVDHQNFGSLIATSSHISGDMYPPLANVRSMIERHRRPTNVTILFLILTLSRRNACLSSMTRTLALVIRPGPPKRGMGCQVLQYRIIVLISIAIAITTTMT